jgi:hypothetical protein
MVSDRDFSHIRWAPFARPSTGTSRGRIPVSGQDGRTGTRDPGDGVVADDARPSVLDLKLGLDGDVGIGVVQPDLSQAVTRVDETLVDRERCKGGREVAAVAALFDNRFVDADLGEEVVGSSAAFLDDDCLRDARVGVAEPVDLQRIGLPSSASRTASRAAPVSGMSRACRNTSLARPTPMRANGTRRLMRRAPIRLGRGRSRD